MCELAILFFLFACLFLELISSDQLNDISEMVKRGEIDVADIPVVENVLIAKDKPLPEDVAYLIERACSSEA
eukprot:m.234349 g.234349  ORF g.234349 m.234349 type:complete len:72 (+) comp13915_c0_seq1:2168-2383(+)